MEERKKGRKEGRKKEGTGGRMMNREGQGTKKIKEQDGWDGNRKGQ